MWRSWSLSLVVVVGMLLGVGGCKKETAGAAEAPRFLLWTRAEGSKKLSYYEVNPQIAANLGKPAPGLEYGVVMSHAGRFDALFHCGLTCAPCRPVQLSIDCPPEPPPCPRSDTTLCPPKFGVDVLRPLARNSELLGLDKEGRPTFEVPGDGR